MACKHCNYKGYIKNIYLKDDTEYINVSPCHKCRDTAAYSAYIKSKYGKNSHNHVEKEDREESKLSVVEEESSECVVFDFQKFKDRRKNKKEE